MDIGRVEERLVNKAKEKIQYAMEQLVEEFGGKYSIRRLNNESSDTEKILWVAGYWKKPGAPLDLSLRTRIRMSDKELVYYTDYKEPNENWDRFDYWNSWDNVNSALDWLKLEYKEKSPFYGDTRRYVLKKKLLMLYNDEYQSTKPEGEPKYRKIYTGRSPYANGPFYKGTKIFTDEEISVIDSDHILFPFRIESEPEVKNPILTKDQFDEYFQEV